jgi:branched-chain amino acid transport system permease protein
MQRRTKLLMLSMVLGVTFLLPIFMHKNGYFLHLITIVTINLILAVSLRLVLLTGHFNLGHAAFAGIGAYTSAILAKRLGFPFFADLFAAGVLASVVACFLGLAILRLRGIYFGLATFTFACLTRLVILYWDSLTGGPAGIRDIPFPNLFGFEVATRLGLSYTGLFLAAVCLSVMYLIENSRVGKTFKAISQAPDLAESVGVNVTGYNIFAFSIASFFAGIAGGFYGHYITYISADRFEVFMSVFILIYNIVGGEASILGPMVGTVFMTLLNEPFRGYTQYEMVFFSLSLMVCILLLPDGLISIPRRIAPYMMGLVRACGVQIRQGK